ncbi:transaldolase [Mumia sp. zg.B53]|uniref:transaldolase n=1 Tax=unclassified Mumia TaxID=2621872 RepID=UPI001C6E0E39|nr:MULTISPECIES: transaldolase [unclassified Mumia]MBW9205228.1 transaldolase [Mumia sp. zg.B17]MBW9213386.1 transaldolase [Mumia sp. zg.B53]
MTDRLKALSDAGVSIWLDDLSRELTETGELKRLVDEDHVVGVTSNPTIFASAMKAGERYEPQLDEGLAADPDTTVAGAVFELTTTDVRQAASILRPVYDATDGVDGRVSIEVEPSLAYDTDQTIATARKLWDKVGEPNVFIKIPATREGIPAIAATIAAGISVNVTLLFALERYREVLDAYASGLEHALADGVDISDVQSVASIFVSRIDSEVDKRLDDIGTSEAMALKGKAGVANSRLAYAVYEEFSASDRWKALEAQGANRQRPLWASTGVKNPDYPDTMYVTELVGPNVVNTMPGATLRAFADHGEVTGDTLTGTKADAEQVARSLTEVGIDLDDVMDTLESEGIDKFESSWTDLVRTVQDQLTAARARRG